MKRSRGVGKVEVDHEAAGGEEICEDEEGGGVSASEKKRRLSGEQVRALERSFEEENKLEPERKAKLAEELGLRPRQVAVWFQNRRARWKTKQLERDFDDLKSRYDALRVSMDLLRADHVALLAQVEDLRAKLEEDEAPLPGKEEEEEDPLLVSTESSENHSGQSQLGSSPAAPVPPPVVGADGETFSYYDGTPPPFGDRHVSCSPTPPPAPLVRMVEEHEFLITHDSPPSSLSWYYFDHWG